MPPTFSRPVVSDAVFAIFYRFTSEQSLLRLNAQPKLRPARTNFVESIPIDIDAHDRVPLAGGYIARARGAGVAAISRAPLAGLAAVGPFDAIRRFQADA